MDRFKEIDAFVQAMAHGSLAAAALAEGVTPVMMGRRLDALEERLGTQLVIRTTRRLTLTDQGASYLDECRQLLARWEDAEKAVSSQHQRASGHLIISAPAAFGRLHVAPHASAFLKANPQVQISFNLTDRVVDLVREGYDGSYDSVRRYAARWLLQTKTAPGDGGHRPGGAGAGQQLAA